MNYGWLQGVYQDYRRGDPETVRGVKELQRRVSVGCCWPRDVAVLKGLDQVHAVAVSGAYPVVGAEDVRLSDATLQTLLDLIAQARRPPSVNLLTAGTSPLRRQGRQGQGQGQGQGAGVMGTTVAGWYDQGPFFGKGAGGGSHGGTPGHAAPLHAMVSHPSGHPSGHPFVRHGTRHHPGGGFASWIGPWGIWPDDCYLDVYGRIWCWGPYGWQVVA